MIRSRTVNVEISTNRFTPLPLGRSASAYQVVSGFQVAREVYYRVSFRFIIVHHLSSTKSLKRFTFRCPTTHLSLAISFTDRFLEFVSVVESYCWLGFVRGHSSTAPLLLIVSAAILSTVTQITSVDTTLLDLPSLAALCEFSPRQP